MWPRGGVGRNFRFSRGRISATAGPTVTELDVRVGLGDPEKKGGRVRVRAGARFAATPRFQFSPFTVLKRTKLGKISIGEVFGFFRDCSGTRPGHAKNIREPFL